MGKDMDAMANHYDGSGMKKLFSHGIRRFNAGAKNSVSRYAVFFDMLLACLGIEWVLDRTI